MADLRGGTTIGGYTAIHSGLQSAILNGTLTIGNLVTFTAQSDGSMRVSNSNGYIDIAPKNSTWAHIYTDRQGFYFNQTNLQANGNTIWHAGNDGSGSGLDADTVDGVQASTFMRATSDGTYYGLTDPSGSTGQWIRTTTNGIIPATSGGASGLGTSSWPFNSVYANNFYGALSGNASTASKLQTARTITLTGDATAPATNFDGSANISMATTLANSGVTAGTYTKVTVDAKGRVTSGTSVYSSDIADATNSNTAQTVVKRDPSGGFNAGTITANFTSSGASGTLSTGKTRTGLGVSGANRWFQIDDTSVANGTNGSGASIQFSNNSYNTWEICTLFTNLGTSAPTSDYLGFYYDGTNPGFKFAIYGNGKINTINNTLDDGGGSMTVAGQLNTTYLTLVTNNNPSSSNTTNIPRFGLWDRAVGSLVLSLGNNDSALFDIIDHAWTRVLFRVTNAGVVSTMNGTVWDTGNLTVSTSAPGSPATGDIWISY